MSITTRSDLYGMERISDIVATTLRQMREFATPGISTKELDEFGGKILSSYGAKSAPKLAYGFPGWTCISVNNEIAHGIPSEKKILCNGDLVNIDVSAELNGFWSDNGSSFVLGDDINGHQDLVEASKKILQKAIGKIQSGVKINEIGRLIETEAHKSGYRVIRNLAGHGIGRNLHEEPREILNCYDKYNFRRFKNESVIAIETFISTESSFAEETGDGWTLVGNRGGFVAQHEHTIVVTNSKPVILTNLNGIWN